MIGAVLVAGTTFQAATNDTLKLAGSTLVLCCISPLASPGKAGNWPDSLAFRGPAIATERGGNRELPKGCLGRED